MWLSNFQSNYLKFQIIYAESGRTGRLLRQQEINQGCWCWQSLHSLTELVTEVHQKIALIWFCSLSPTNTKKLTELVLDIHRYIHSVLERTSMMVRLYYRFGKAPRGRA